MSGKMWEVDPETKQKVTLSDPLLHQLTIVHADFSSSKKSRRKVKTTPA
jgi:hypothetical protein